jgi:hypothetical protein
MMDDEHLAVLVSRLLYNGESRVYGEGYLANL